MGNNYWLVIDTLRQAIDGRLSCKTLAEARFLLSVELDRTVVGGLPTEELSRLIGVFDGLSDIINAE